ncbi:Lysyl-tRNA synthetase-like protein [Pleurostoma richardsiae]|uniref:Lysyl-tRNA synthetase n=1 Tax=Pleurostoma richardsiae TaxID=41990 RepID=A0AA38RKJ1_9PEZI|nr:Lysyl-tRNA synthetase-like protein [Pleurostoma richardsiae]
MNTSQLSLQFLRPYAFGSLPLRRPAYLAFYELVSARGACRIGRQTRCLATARQQGADGGEYDPEKTSAFIAGRIRKLSEAHALSYPRLEHHGTAMTIPAFREKFKGQLAGSYTDQEVALHGRIRSIRRASSKLLFIDLVEEFERVQGLCNYGKFDSNNVSLEQFKSIARLLQRGDHVAITGRVTRTPTGELTLEATELPRLLSPSLVPIPEKLQDEDQRIQNRHLDMLVNQETADVLRLRSYVIKYMRDFFHDRGFLEFQTPILAGNASGATARPFSTTASEFPDKELALRIAPELWLKRLVIGGVDKVFEIGPAFRNEGIDATHNPEFTTCEFYNAYANLQDLISQTEQLLTGLAEHSQTQISEKLTSLEPINLSSYARPYKQLEFIPSLEAALGFQFPDLNMDTAFADLLSLLETHDLIGQLGSAPIPSLNKLLDRLAAVYLEPHSATSPLFITHHPACMAPLSKSFTCPKTGQVVSARAELFMGGRELANMYEEENDPFAQRRKLVEQARAKEQQQRTASSARSPEEDDEPAHVVDESYISALEAGLPPTGGWGCGIERLVMLFSGARRISDCLSFGTLRNVVGLSSAGRKDV